MLIRKGQSKDRQRLAIEGQTSIEGKDPGLDNLSGSFTLPVVLIDLMEVEREVMRERSEHSAILQTMQSRILSCLQKVYELFQGIDIRTECSIHRVDVPVSEDSTSLRAIGI